MRTLRTDIVNSMMREVVRIVMINRAERCTKCGVLFGARLFEQLMREYAVHMISSNVCLGTPCYVYRIEGAVESCDHPLMNPLQSDIMLE